MKKIQRLKQKEIQTIIKKNFLVKNELFICYFEESLCEMIKFAICPSKKISTHVLKNKIKRQLREILKNFFDKKLKIVLVVKKNYFDYSYQRVGFFVCDIFDKIEKQKKEIIL